MRRSPAPTIAETPAPCVLVVGLSSASVRLCAEAAAMAAAARVVESELEQAATAAAKWRPLAIVVSDAAYLADASELEALARDVRAGLVRIPNREMSSEELQAMLLRAVASAERMRAD